jgi:glyoxylase-like metal-dependent hydrolase (beta-lactamase superfamily II)/rhodanese-related sulfurtransferase
MAAGAVHPIEDHGLGNTSYLVEAGRGLAFCVDPPRETSRHRELAGELGLRIAASLETHLHADFVSGARELSESVGAEVIAPSQSRLRYRHRAACDDRPVAIGDVLVRPLGTPGHTPEHLSYVLCAGGEATAAFTGGSLIFGGAARTDLISPDRTEGLARAQFGSLRRIAALPAATALYPTHGQGSFCSAGPAAARAGTIGDELAANPLLRIADEEAFVRALTAGFGSFPPYFLELRAVNREPTLTSALERPRAMPPDDVAAWMRRGARLVDCRDLDAWASGHPAGSVSIVMRPAFASWLGWVVGFGSPLILLAEPRDVPEAVRQARGIGYDAVLGWIDGGIDAWREAGLPVVATDLVAADEALARASRGSTLLDIRQAAEVASRPVNGALHVELGDVIAGAVPPSDDVVCFCGHGERGATAASILERIGVRAAVLLGGPADLEDAR